MHTRASGEANSLTRFELKGCWSAKRVAAARSIGLSIRSGSATVSCHRSGNFMAFRRGRRTSTSSVPLHALHLQGFHRVANDRHRFIGHGFLVVGQLQFDDLLDTVV